MTATETSVPRWWASVLTGAPVWVRPSLTNQIPYIYVHSTWAPKVHVYPNFFKSMYVSSRQNISGHTHDRELCGFFWIGCTLVSKIMYT
jgi:hypothetical protein